MEELHSRHRVEQKELQNRVTQKKKNATKKTRKGVNEECERLQRELRDRQQAEIDSALGHVERTIDSLNVQDDHERHESESDKAEEPSKPNFANQRSSRNSLLPAHKKPNRQKARIARRAAENEAQAEQAAKEAAQLPDLREREVTTMQKHLENLGLKEISIRPDGHCMYSAVAMLLQNSARSDRDRLETGGLLPYQAVRAETAQYVSENSADFEAFLEEPILQYTNKIKNTTEWGGQLELQAIARAYHVEVNVLQADGRIEKVEFDGEARYDPVWLAYYRHSFGLGEHYNALSKDS